MPALGSRLSALGSRLSALGSRLSALGSRLSALGSRLSALGSRLSALGSRLSALGSRLSALGSRLSALGSRLSALGSRLSALGSRLSALGSRLSALGSRLSALGSRLSALGSRLSALLTCPVPATKAVGSEGVRVQEWCWRATVDILSFGMRRSCTGGRTKTIRYFSFLKARTGVRGVMDRVPRQTGTRGLAHARGPPIGAAEGSDDVECDRAPGSPAEPTHGTRDTVGGSVQIECNRHHGVLRHVPKGQARESFDGAAS